MSAPAQKAPPATAAASAAAATSAAAPKPAPAAQAAAPTPTQAAQPAKAVQAVTPTAAPPPPQSKKLKKGDRLFDEGENSRAMYYLKSGIVRIYKRKGDAQIEIDTIHSGQILGELAFLDGNPRSASAEALTEVELVEISGPAFTAMLAKTPEWLKILLKTIVTRLRTASTRIRQLETASSALDYSDKDGKRTQSYVYLSNTDVMKLASAVLLVAARNGTVDASGIDLKIGLVQRYANQIMGVPTAKITSFLDLLVQANIVTLIEQAGVGDQYRVTDVDFLEKLTWYLNEENLLEPSKKHDISLKGFMLMSLIAKHLSGFPADVATGLATVNLADIKKAEQAVSGKEPFKLDDMNELVKLGYATTVNLKSNDEIFTLINSEEFKLAYRFQRVIMTINSVNEQKRKGAK